MRGKNNEMKNTCLKSLLCGKVVKEKIRKQNCHEEGKNRASKVDESTLKIQAKTLVSSDKKQLV